jgi:uncharacterized protein
MQINVSQLLKSAIGTQREYDISDYLDLIEGSEKSLIEGNVKLTRTNRGVLAKGHFKAKIKIDCSRCLKTFEYPLDILIEEEFFPVIDVISGFALPLPEEPGYFTIDEHHILDLSEAVRQSSLLAMPMKPLCRVDCAGLCTECGQDLNEGECDCAKQNIDPRWAKLVKLAAANKKKLNKKNKE